MRKCIPSRTLKIEYTFTKTLFLMMSHSVGYAKQKNMGDCSGSKKDYSFQLGGGNGDEVHLFECAIFATLEKMKAKN